MTWSHICVEAFCLAECEGDEYPCGQKYPTVKCLLNRKCPNLAYANSNKREISKFVPWHLLVKDRLFGWSAALAERIRWFAWDRWRYDPKAWSRIVSGFSEEVAEESPEHQQEKLESDKRFEKWFKGTKEEFKWWKK